MKRRILLTLTIAALVALAIVPSAQAAFGFAGVDDVFLNPDDTPATQAGSHPFAQTVSLSFNTSPEPVLGYEVPDADPRDVIVALPPGFVGDPGVVPTCSSADFIAESCGAASQIGKNNVVVSTPSSSFNVRVDSLEPPPGVVMRLGFIVLKVPVTIDLSLNPNPPYNVLASSRNIDNPIPFYRTELSAWGVPASPAHDIERGCGGSCKLNLAEEPLLTLPRACEGPLPTDFAADSWQNPGALLPNGEPDLSDPAWETASVLTHDGALPSNPQGMTGCGKLGFEPSISAQATSKSASSPTGLDFSLDVKDEGLLDPDGYAASDIRKTVVTLPEGMTANPSVAEGLEVCSEAQLARETASSEAGEGCPPASKIGTVEVQTPLLDQSLSGALYQAKPYENLAGNALIALYVVIKNRDLGIVVRQPLRVEPDPRTGQLRGIAEEIPQLPFSSFRLHFREGGRSPLISPPACGTHTTEATLYPWAGSDPVTTTSSFQVIAGPNGGPCPAAGAPPFAPGFEAGTLNNNAGSHSPFYMRLTRRDGDQDLTKFSAKLPPGMVATLAGTSECPEAAIAQARSRTGKGGGALELASPSCPASSQIGRVMAGAGVGSQLTYVPGRIYLAGPYNGAPLSVVAVVPAVAGPFDVGTVVTRQALRIDPRTAEVTADGSSSDPIPHILAGIPLAVRDIRVYVDKPDFTLNPTSCDPFSVDATMWGSGSDRFGSGDDSPLSLAARFQAANCASLGFKPRLSLALKGGIRRGDHPALTGTYRPRVGDANLESLVLRLPRSAFLDQAHIRTICTRVQFAAKSCPKAAIYGQATAWTPILEQPLKGPVYLRSSNHNLPDFVADLHGLVDVEAVARIDAVKGGIRASFEDVPDAPLSKVVVRMQGQKKGLIVNSRDLCSTRNRANASFAGHNGKGASGKPVVGAQCGRKGRQ